MKQITQIFLEGERPTLTHCVKRGNSVPLYIETALQ